MTATELKKLVREAANGPDAKTRVGLYQKALAHAIELGDEKTEFKIRYELVTEELYHAPDTELSLACFAWCLAKLDEDASRYASATKIETLMWAFKWILEMLIDSAAFPREQIEAALDDMERRYKAQGYGIHGVLTTRHSYAWATGLIDQADTLLHEIERTPRDSQSDCEACVSAQRVAYASELRRDEDALAEYRTMMERSPYCGEQPESTKAHILMPMLRAGLTDEAAAAFKEAYEGCRTREKLLDAVADCARFAAVTGNESAALGIVERHIGWLDYDPLATRNHFNAATCFDVALARLERIGHGDTQTQIPHVSLLEDVAPGLGRNPTVSALRKACHALAERIAVQMDARNGNDAWSRELEASRADVEVDARIVLESAPFNPLAGAPAEPEDADGWLMRARGLGTVGRHDEALQAAERAVVEADAAGSASDTADASATASSALAIIATLRALEGDADGVEKAIARRVEVLEAANDPIAALVRRYGAALARPSEVSQEQFEEAYADATALGGAVVGGGEDFALQIAITAAGTCIEEDPDTARVWFDRATELFDPAAEPYRDFQCKQLACRLALHDGEAEAAASAALDRAAAAREPLLKASAEAMAAKVMGALGATEQAGRLADAAANRFAANGSIDPAVQMSVAAGEFWAAAGEHLAATSRFEFALPRMATEGHDTTELRVSLAESLVRVDREEEASALVEPLVDRLQDDREQWRLLVRVLWILASGARQEDDELTALYGRAADLARDHGTASTRGYALLRWYDALDEDYFDMDDVIEQVAAQLDDVRTELAIDDPMRAECVWRLLDYAKEYESDAAELIEDGLACIAALEPSALTSRVAMNVAHVLMGAGDVERAVAVLEEAHRLATDAGADEPDVDYYFYLPLGSCAKLVKDAAEQERLFEVCLEYADAPPWFHKQVKAELAKLRKKRG